jgi:6-methylsalicylate decarboxylase
VLEEVDRRGSFVFVHPGPSQPPRDLPAWWSAAVDYCTEMQAAYVAWLAEGVERWPTVRVLFAILAGGAPFQLERLQSRGVDIRPALRSTLFLDAASYGRRALELCFATFGARQIVFGSDAPVLETRLTLEPVRSFGQAASDALCCENPHRLLT